MNDHNGSGQNGGARSSNHRASTPTGQSQRLPSAGTNGESPDNAMRVLSYVISGIVLYGGLGWLVDHFWHQSWGLPTGLILGMGLSIFLIIRRFGGQL